MKYADWHYFQYGVRWPNAEQMERREARLAAAKEEVRELQRKSRAHIAAEAAKAKAARGR